MTTATDRYLTRFRAVLAYIDAHVDEAIDVDQLAAVAALERGRQRMCNVWDTRTALPRARLVSIAAEVVADFWARLASFASLGIAPRGWHSVPPGHPFLCCVSDRVVLNGPPDVASPPGSPVP